MRNKIQLLGLIFSALLFGGCASVTDTLDQAAGRGVVIKKTTGDGVTLVEATPTFLYRDGALMGLPFHLGAFWSSDSPNSAILLFEYNSTSSSGDSYRDFKEIEVGTGDTVDRFVFTERTSRDAGRFNSATANRKTSTWAPIVVPLDVIRGMVSSEKATLTIRTRQGVEMADLGAERTAAGQATAPLRLKEFLSVVDAVE